ncbi:MAG: restriction endonuclease [Myxococcota bacterium]|nr:restriction endonuclease [Myxococcota bacterium]
MESIDMELDGSSIVSTLIAAGRPLSIRRLHKILDGLSDTEGPSEATIDTVLRQACSAGSVREVRQGVFVSTDDERASRAEGHERPARARSGRRRRSRLARASEGLPSAPLSLDETAALSVQAGSPQQLRQAMWMRMRRKAIEVAGLMDPEAAAAPDPTDSSTGRVGLDESSSRQPPEGLGALIREAVSSGPHARLRVVSKSRPWDEDDHGGGAIDGDEASPGDWRDDALRQVRFPSDLGVDEFLQRPTTLEGAASLVVGGRAPYRDRRTEDRGPPADERRHHDGSAMPSRVSLSECARAVLSQHGAPLTVQALDAIVVEEIGADGGALTSRILSDNETRLRSGHRPHFVLRSDGRIGLTDWGLPTRFEVHENRLKQAKGEVDELVKRALLQRVSEQSHRVFHRLMVLLLERLAFQDLRELNMSSAGQLAFVGRRESGVDREDIAVFAVNGWRRIDSDTVRIVEENLEHFGAKTGLIMTVGTFTQGAVAAASGAAMKAVRLVDGAGLADLLFSHGLGVQSYRVKVPYIDGGFFSALEQ